MTRLIPQVEIWTGHHKHKVQSGRSDTFYQRSFNGSCPIFVVTVATTVKVYAARGCETLTDRYTENTFLFAALHLQWFPHCIVLKILEGKASLLFITSGESMYIEIDYT